MCFGVIFTLDPWTFTTSYDVIRLPKVASSRGKSPYRNWKVANRPYILVDKDPLRSTCLKWYRFKPSISTCAGILQGFPGWWSAMDSEDVKRHTYEVFDFEHINIMVCPMHINRHQNEIYTYIYIWYLTLVTFEIRSYTICIQHMFTLHDSYNTLSLWIWVVNLIALWLAFNLRMAKHEMPGLQAHGARWIFGAETCPWKSYMGVSLNSGTPKSSILIGFSIINHPFWGTTILGNPHIPSIGTDRLPTSIFQGRFAVSLRECTVFRWVNHSKGSNGCGGARTVALTVLYIRDVYLCIYVCN